MSRDILFITNIRSLHALLALVYMIKEGETVESLVSRLITKYKEASGAI